MISCVLSEINQPFGRSKSKDFKFKADLRNKRDAVSDKILKGGLERQFNSGCLPGSVLTKMREGVQGKGEPRVQAKVGGVTRKYSRRHSYSCTPKDIATPAWAAGEREENVCKSCSDVKTIMALLKGHPGLKPHPASKSQTPRPQHLPRTPYMVRSHSGPEGIPSLHCPDLLQSLIKVELNPSHDGPQLGWR